MTPKQERFIQEYLIDLNATQAAIRAGYSKKGADVQGHRLLGNVKISEAIQKAREELSERTGITQDMVIRELAKIGFANIEDYIQVQEDGTAFVKLNEVSRDQFAAIGEITSEVYTEGKGEDAQDVKRTKLKLLDKKGALVDLGKHLGMFVEQHQVDVVNYAVSNGQPADIDEWQQRYSQLQ